MNKKSAIIIVFFFCWLYAFPVAGAELKFDVAPMEIRAGDEFKISIYVDSAGESINALEGKVSIPSEILEIKEVRAGNSVALFWAEPPRILPGGKIVFSGVIPGGYSGGRGLVFSAVLKAKLPGRAGIVFDNVRVLLNDGLGTAAKVSTVASSVLIFPSEEVRVKSAEKEPEDRTPPEGFKPYIARSPDVFGNKWFAAFAAQDKSSGVTKYEISERRPVGIGEWKWPGKWTEAQSPFLLKDQSLKSYVYVKAADAAGNIRQETIPPQAGLAWYENALNWAAGALAVLAIFGLRLLRRKAMNKNG